MKTLNIIITLLFVLLTGEIYSQTAREVISLNGEAAFEQTETACPPKKFTHTIQVPGLIDLAKPKIKQYDEYFNGTQKPRYSWYKFTFKVPGNLKNRFAVLNILKSRFGTQIFLNGHDMGEFIQNNTPIRCNLTPYLKYGKTNTLFIRVGERTWLSNESATGYDREKYANIPGIWDNISIEFTGPVSVKNMLILPDIADTSVTVKLMLENLANVLERNMEYSLIDYNLNLFIREKKSKKIVSDTLHFSDKIQCQQLQKQVFKLSLKDMNLWSPETPFLYEAVVNVEATGKYFDDYGNPENLKPENNYNWIGESDHKVSTFGMRSFKNVGKTFELNGKEYRFFGSTIALNRFFEDKERGSLPWDTAWVKKLLVSIPKSLGWNFFRVHIGLLPSFWYDLADEYGFLIQNEYPMWNLRGRNSGYEKEYTDWIWADGNHPSIVIWDALNEQKQSFIGNVVIPELRKLDPTRIWDAGFMESDELIDKQVTEVHWYPLAFGWWYNDSLTNAGRKEFTFGDLTKPYAGLKDLYKINTPVILNEFGWLWQNRSTTRSGIRTYGQFRDSDNAPYKKNYEYYEPDGSQLYGVRDLYNYYLGADADSPAERRTFQTYVTAIEIETIRATRQVAGVASFPYLINNNGYTGDWFENPIKDLKPSSTLLMQKDAMRPFAAFINLTDGRYLKDAVKYTPGSELCFDIIVVNDAGTDKSGVVNIKITDKNGKTVYTYSLNIEVDKFWQKSIPVKITLPEKAGGYAVLAELSENGSNETPHKSVRFIKVGNLEKYDYPVIKYQQLNKQIK